MWCKMLLGTTILITGVLLHKQDATIKKLNAKLKKPRPFMTDEQIEMHKITRDLCKITLDSGLRALGLPVSQKTKEEEELERIKKVTQELQEKFNINIGEKQ